MALANDGVTRATEHIGDDDLDSLELRGDGETSRVRQQRAELFSARPVDIFYTRARRLAVPRLMLRDLMARYLKHALAALFTGYFAALAGLVAFQRDFLFRPDARRADPAAAGLAEAQENDAQDARRRDASRRRVSGDCGRPFILYLHGNGGALRDRVPRFRRFVEDRFGMLAVSYRGYGGSTGVPARASLPRRQGRA